MTPISSSRLAHFGAAALFLAAVSVSGCGTYHDTASEPSYDTAPQVTLLPPQVYYYEPGYSGSGNYDRRSYGPGYHGYGWYDNPPNYQD